MDHDDKLYREVVEALRARGYEAHYEHPGFVGVTFGDGHYMAACGTDDPRHDWYCCLNAVTPGLIDDLGEAVGAGVSARSTKPDRIADGIIHALEAWLARREAEAGSSN